MFQTRSELKKENEALRKEVKRLQEMFDNVQRAGLSGCESILCKTCEHGAYYELSGFKRLVGCDLNVSCKDYKKIHVDLGMTPKESYREASNGRTAQMNATIAESTMGNQKR